MAESTDGRSQIKNREIAMNRLYDKVREAQREAVTSAYASHRKSLVGTGDRSDKIRTYTKPGEALIIFQLADSSPPGEVDDLWYTVRKKVGDMRWQSACRVLWGRSSTTTSATCMA